MGNLKIGQEVICVVNTSEWISDIDGDVTTKGPKFGDIYTIDGKCEQGGLIFNVLSSESWHWAYFKPLSEIGTDNIIEEEIKAPSELEVEEV